MAARKQPQSDSHVTRYEAAKLIGVTPRTIQRWVESGELEGTQTEGGIWQIPLAAVQAIAAERPQPEGPDVETTESIGTPAAIMHHATTMARDASASLQWLVKMQQEVISALSSELGTVQTSYSQAIRAEAQQRLETELAIRAEARKDKALDEVMPFAERILSQSVQSRAGSRVLDALARLDDEQWETVRGMATELLEMPQADVAQLDALRSERKKEGEK